MATGEIRFGPFRLDCHQRALWHDHKPVRLGRRALEILCELALAEGRIVSKDDLMERLWAGRVVEEGNIHVHVSALRKALDEHEDGHSYVVTVPGRGYRLAVGDGPPPGGHGQPAPGMPAAALADQRFNGTPRLVEKRQLTVVSCELVGAPRLAASLDPEDLSALMALFHQYLRETVGRFGGMVTRPAGGDWLACFGYPQAGEHDAEQAIRASLALVDESARLGDAAQLLPLRVGLATGPVVLQALDGGNVAEQESLLGEPVSQAAALRRTAQPGKVVVAASTRRLVGKLFEFRRIGKGRVDARGPTIDAFEVLRPGALPSRFEALHGASLTPLVGREEELGMLLRCWQRARAGELRAVLISGEPGIGKSRLTVELQRQLRKDRFTCLRFFCSPHHQDSALYPVMRQLEAAAGFERNDTGAAKLAKLAKLKNLIANAPGSDADVVALADILSLPAGQPDTELTPRRKRELAFEALTRQVEAAARRAPVLMVFEDIHWSDPTTLEWIDLLFQKLPRRPILLLITFRTEFAVPWSERAQVTSLMLHRLGQQDSAALVRAAVGAGGLSADDVAEVAGRADGVPLFLEELSRTLAESGTGANEPDGGPGRSRTAIPSTLQASLMERFDKLDSVTKEVAQAGAAIGREFSRELIAQVCEQASTVLDAALDSLVVSGLAFRRGVAPDAVFIFKHGLVQDAIYATLLRSRRQQLHARIAQALERIAPQIQARSPEILAHHFTQAAQHESATRYWRLAIERALRTSAYQEAVGQCARGLQAIESIALPDRRLREEMWLQLHRGIALTAQSGPSASEMLDAFTRARETAEQLGDERILASALLGLWAHHNARAHLRPALALAQHLAGIGQSRGNEALCVQAHAASLTVTYKMGLFSQAWQHFESGIALYRPGMEVIEAIPNYTRPGADLLLHGSFVAWVMGHPERARQLARDTMTAAHQLNQPYTTTHCVYMLGHLAELQGDWRAVRQANEQTVELAMRWGFTGTLQLAQRRIALVAVALDRDEVQFRFKCEHRQPGFARSLHDVVLARMHASLGMAERGLKLLDETMDYSQETASSFYDAEVHRTRGMLLALLGRKKEAQDSYLAGIETARRQGARMWELRSAVDLASFWAEDGQRRRAADLLAAIYSQFTEGLDVADLQTARKVLEAVSA